MQYIIPTIITTSSFITGYCVWTLCVMAY